VIYLHLKFLKHICHSKLGEYAGLLCFYFAFYIINVCVTAACKNNGSSQSTLHTGQDLAEWHVGSAFLYSFAV